MTVVRLSAIVARHLKRRIACQLLHVFVLHSWPVIFRIWRRRAGVHVAIAFIRASVPADDRKAEGCKVVSAFPQQNPGRVASNADNAAWSPVGDHDERWGVIARASMNDAPGDEGGEVGNILVC